MIEVELIKGLKNGDSNAYSFMVDQYHNKLCVYAYQLTNDRDHAKDIVQNVFVKIWTIRQKLKDEFNVKGYLYKSVYNEFLNQERSRRQTITLDNKNIEALDLFIESEDEQSMDWLIDLVKKGINNLPPRCKEIFILSKNEGLTNIEIAEYLNVSVKSVEAQITKAFMLLRAISKIFIIFNCLGL
jgi:RNA polymerase sigma-70 factor (family 1)